MMPIADSTGLRLDKALWCLRFARSRNLAQTMVNAGHIRLDGRRMSRPSATVRPGQVLVLPLGERIAVIRLLLLPQRRLNATEAARHYIRLDPSVDENDSQQTPSIDEPRGGGIGDGLKEITVGTVATVQGSPKP